ncbi:MAG: hypothetical protein ACKPFA_32100 [Dolichospermum sp.]
MEYEYKVRNTRLLQLISYVAQTPDTQDVIKNKVEVEQELPVTEKLLEPQNKFQPPRQLMLF